MPVTEKKQYEATCHDIEGSTEKAYCRRVHTFDRYEDAYEWEQKHKHAHTFADGLRVEWVGDGGRSLDYGKKGKIQHVYMSQNRLVVVLENKTRECGECGTKLPITVPHVDMDEVRVIST